MNMNYLVSIQSPAKRASEREENRSEAKDPFSNPRSIRGAERKRLPLGRASEQASGVWRGDSEREIADDESDAAEFPSTNAARRERERPIVMMRDSTCRDCLPAFNPSAKLIVPRGKGGKALQNRAHPRPHLIYDYCCCCGGRGT